MHRRLDDPRRLRLGMTWLTATASSQVGGRRGRRFEFRDGRALGYDDHGPVDGQPIFYFHGVPSSRLDLHMFAGASLAERLGGRIIAVDRPGCGLSDFMPSRRMSDWPADVAALAGGLGLARGGRDTEAPPAMGRWLAEAVPGCRGRFLPEEAHISLIVRRTEQIVRELLERTARHPTEVSS